MVLQRDINAPVWGTSAPGDAITVTFKGQKKSATADASGAWMIRLDPLPASAESAILTIIGANDKKEFQNVLVGDVWLCSGQSNMECAFKEVPDEAAGVNIPEIRLVGGMGKISPIANDVFPHFSWQPCTAASMQEFSRVGYYFGLKLRQELKVPIGLINASQGCSSIEAWMAPECFTANERWKANLIEMEMMKKVFQEYGGYSSAEKDRLALEHCRDNIGRFANSYMINGRPDPAKYENFLWHMLVVRSGCLYTHAIRPVIPYGIKGAIWYQGETNLYDNEYAARQKSLIETWRALWGSEFHFYIVQIAPFKGYTDILPSFWLEQYAAARSTKHCGLIPTVDISDVNDVHPRDKRFVGLRLALLALNETYGRKDIAAHAPMYRAMEINGDTIRISFDNAGSGLTTKDGKSPDWFEIAGADGKFTAAEARIDGDGVTLQSSLTKEPRAVRFAWSGIAEPNLRNREGLPVFPFDTTARESIRT